MNKTHPKVTVLMAVYNGEDHLSESIESILAQTFEDFEFLIVNDGSTDRSRDVVLSYRNADPRIRLIDNPQNIGLPKSLNLGLRRAKGEYVARQDADDLSAPLRLEAQVEFLDSRPEVHAVGCWFESVDEQGLTFGYERPSDRSPSIPEQLSAGINPLAHGSVTFRRQTVVDLGGYDERFWYAQDFELWLRLFSKASTSGAILPQLLYKRRKRPSGSAFKSLCQQRYGQLALRQSKTGNRMEFDDVRQWVRENHPESLDPDPRVQGKYWILLGMTALDHQKKQLARSYVRQALKTPYAITRLKALCLMALSVLPLSPPGLSRKKPLKCAY